MLKKIIYKKVFLEEDANNIAQHFEKDPGKVKNIMGNIHPKFYEKLVDKVAEEITHPNILKIPSFRKNEKVYRKYFLKYDVQHIVKHIKDKKALQTITSQIHPKCRFDVYARVIQFLPKEEAEKYHRFIEQARAKDLSFFYKEESSDKEKELLNRIHFLEEEMKQMKEQLAKQETKSKDKTEDFGEKIFS